MKSASLRDWLEIVGIFSVVASPVFVGLQMRQASEISLSQAYQARTSAAAEWNSAFAANPAALAAFRKGAENNVDDITTAEFDALRRTIAGLFYLYDNAHYQYEAGFVSEDFWAITRESIRIMRENPAVESIFADIVRRAGRPGFREFLRQMDVSADARQADRKQPVS